LLLDNIIKGKSAGLSFVSSAFNAKNLEVSSGLRTLSLALDGIHFFSLATMASS